MNYIDFLWMSLIILNIVHLKLTASAISKLLSLHYVLGKDIDYSVMKSKGSTRLVMTFTSKQHTINKHLQVRSMAKDLKLRICISPILTY